MYWRVEWLSPLPSPPFQMHVSWDDHKAEKHVAKRLQATKKE
jgi:hypothetical protein